MVVMAMGEKNGGGGGQKMYVTNIYCLGCISRSPMNYLSFSTSDVGRVKISH